ncbi:MAG: ZIP family zinc transporter [Chloroflexota bacterium]|nr:ZIP family zinc transporter [Chloroflexota bacterium]
MLEAGLWGLAAASALVIGAVAEIGLHISRRITALIMAFGAGALVSALAFDLTEEAFRRGGTGIFAAGLAAGALAFFVGNRLVIRSGAPGRARRSKAAGTSSAGSSNGPAIVLGTLLDGLPESIVLGATLLGGATVSASFLAAVFLSNIPEGAAGTRDLSEEGHARRWILLLWVGVALASGLASGLGYGLLGGMNQAAVAVVQAFAAGAILTMLADTMIPEAFENGGDLAGLATALGFAAAFLLSTT